MEFIMEITK